MYRPRIIPCLLLKGDGLVKTTGFENPRYIGDPINAVRIFNELEADELVFLDINASKENRTISLEVVKKIGEEAFMPFAVGGGIHNIEDAKDLLSAGAEKIILNTSAIENPDLVKEAAEIFGNQSVIVSIDVRKINGNYEVFIYGGTKETGKKPVEVAKELEKLGAGEILINSIDEDGKMGGYDLELIKKVSEEVKVPVVACGGAGKFEDFKKVVDAGATAVSAGSLFIFAGKGQGVLINYPEQKEIEGIFKDFKN